MISLTEPRRIGIDTSGLVSIGPTALALTAAVFKEADKRGVFADGSWINTPRSWPVKNYLQRMDLFKFLFAEGVYDEETHEDFERRKAKTFRPVREFQTPAECQAVARDLTDALTATCQTDQIARNSIRICLDELAENVLHHADAPLGGFAAAQGWAKTSTFEIGIVDLGIGIRASLNKNPEYADIDHDLTAIQTALRPRVSSTPERNAGIGLFITKLLLRENGGHLVVRSGLGAVYSGSEESSREHDVALPGTLVALRARTNQPLDVNEVYRALGDDDDSGHDDVA